MNNEIYAYKILIILIVLILMSTGLVSAQEVKELRSIKAEEPYENILIVPVATDKHTSSYVIFIKKNVRLHKHAVHTEQVLILAGKGTMTVDGKEVKVKKGDYIFLPEGLPHGVVITSKKPMKVLSVQAPEFHGKDRIFLDGN